MKKARVRIESSMERNADSNRNPITQFNDDYSAMQNALGCIRHVEAVTYHAAYTDTASVL